MKESIFRQRGWTEKLVNMVTAVAEFTWSLMWEQQEQSSSRSLCFRALSGSSGSGRSSPEGKISTFSLQNAKTIRNVRRSRFFERQTRAGNHGSDSHFMAVLSTESVHHPFIWQEAIPFAEVMQQDFSHERNSTSQGGVSSCPLLEIILPPSSLSHGFR